MRFNKTTRIAAAVAVIGAVAAGGAAFTASESLPTNVAGYGTTTVTGGTVTDLSYGLSSYRYQTLSAPASRSSGDITGDTVGILAFDN